ncbi:T9SS type A sorting domain-containing protein [Flavobacteriales bacterium]|nr:T9SS type A sorting domain-containing protein [Flavobacteriales bacterium]
MRFTPFLFLVLLPALLQAQSIRYSNFYELNNGAGGFVDGALLDDGRLIAVGSVLNLSDNVNFYNGFHAIVDANGDELATQGFNPIGKNFNTRSVLKTDSPNALFSAGYFCDFTVTSPGYCDFYFSRLDMESGDTLFTRIIERKDTSDVLLSMVETRPNKIMLIGWTYNDTTDANADLLFITVDTLGNELNRVVYGGGGTDFIRPAVIADEDGDVLMTGFTRSYPSVNSGRTWVIRTDSIGNVEWHQTYSGFVGGNSGGGGITNLLDGNFMVAGSYISSSITNGYLMKIAPDGNMIWQKSIGIGDEGQSFWAVKELPDGTLVATGPTNVTGDGSQAGWLVKTDEIGDTLWTRTYNPSSSTDYLRNMLVMPNGDIVMVGFGRGENSSTQDGWILRVDSMGCEIENCFSVGIEEEQKETGLSVYPNPVTDVLRVRFADNSVHSLVAITITDLLGRVVLRSSEKGNTALDVSALKRGIYMLRTTDESGRMATVKFVRE